MKNLFLVSALALSAFALSDPVRPKLLSLIAADHASRLRMLEELIALV